MKATKGQNKSFPSLITVSKVALQILVDYTIAKFIDAYPESFQNHIENKNKTQTSTY